METSVDCFVAVNEQDSDQRTYAEIDGTLLVNQTGEFFGKTVDGSLTVVRDIADACLNTTQNIRMTVTIDGEDVTDSLIGSIAIAHNKNYISTFSLQLCDPKYSPLTDSHIAINSEVIITTFINGQEIKVFTGLVDNTNTDFNGGYRLMIKGRGYGKKLLEKTMTLISIEQAANKKYRGSLVEYIAEQGSITSIDIPIGDAIGIDHSFQDQSLWDMIQKECAIEGWYVRFDENGKMILKTMSKKTTADWEYGEDKFEELGLETTDRGIINKVTILGAIYEEEVITQDETEQEVEPAEEPEDTYTDYSFSPSFSAGEVVSGWSEGDAIIKVTAFYVGFTKPSGYIFPTSQNYKFTISGSDAGKIKGLSFSVTGEATKGAQGSNSVTVLRDCTGMFPSFSEGAFGVTITFKILDEGDAVEDLEEENPEDTFTSTIIRHQVKATVQDNNSIAIYGERKPNNEGTLDFPLAETEAQCKRIGENVILESHRFIKQPDYLVAFNPKLIVGCTVKITSATIGYGENWVVEEVIHIFDIGKDGEIKARTRIGCVYYA